MLALGEFDRDQPEKTADPDLQLVPFCLGRSCQRACWCGPREFFFRRPTVPGCLMLTIVSDSGYFGSIASVEGPGLP